MGSKVVIVTVVVLVGVWLALFTQGRNTPPSGETNPTVSETPSDPSDRGDVVHLLETHGIHIGEATDNDIIVQRSGEKIQIEITDEFLNEVPDTLLGTLGWTRSTNWLSEEGYSNFLDSLHTFLIEEMPEEHGHSHGEHGHEHEDHGHDHDEGHEHDH
ncbi:MAG: hypothetical protein KC964_25385 [Candidatus Omnitrophica bacterium]|nr:hypothetical protein [Candidatus Omnitrophota bacterium]